MIILLDTDILSGSASRLARRAEQSIQLLKGLDAVGVSRLGPLVHEEVVLKLGTGHGAFYRPGDWIGRVAGWVKQASGSGS